MFALHSERENGVAKIGLLSSLIDKIPQFMFSLTLKMKEKEKEIVPAIKFLNGIALQLKFTQ